MNMKGCYTALVTPFVNGDVCFDTLRKLVEDQVHGGVDGIVPVGTTGESPTLSIDEHKQVIEAVVKAVAGRCQVIAGTGGNSTAEALELTRHAKAAGSDGTLQVTPYYNKPTQEGLYQHFCAVADIGLPVVLYNIPGRTGIPIDIETVLRLNEHEHIVAIKEAAGSVDRVSDISRRCDITILSGDDALTLPMMSVGAAGVISVASNIAPAQVTELTRAAAAGDLNRAMALHRQLYPLFDVTMCETNPIPVKTALAMMGMIEEEFRLPMCKISDAGRDAVKAVLQAMNLLGS